MYFSDYHCILPNSIALALKPLFNANLIPLFSISSAFGNLILIKHHNNKTSAYAHLDKINVKKGESVNKGQIIALVGNSGKVSIPQLHFEIRDKDGPLDPLKYLP
mgnify:CR=1 FL=1